jgi:Secretion system C-terminal sorting domain
MKERILNLALFFLILLFFIFVNNTFAQQLQITEKGNTAYLSLMSNSKICLTAPAEGNNCSRVIINRRGLNESDNINTFNWVLKFTDSNRVFKDISFANLQIGYIVTELGAVYKTTNGGDNWVQKLNLGFPYYWYGVYALTMDTVIISGFNNQGPVSTGVVRWTFNGGNNWSQDIVLGIPTGVGWLSNVHFFNQNTGFVVASFSGGVHYTTSGGRDSSSWNYVQVNQDLGWFAGNIDAQNSGNVYMTGIHLARSTNYGLNWTSGPSADNIFDGGIDFLDNNNMYGWTGGGQISSPVSGWVHWTTDGGSSWSARYDFPYPIRAVRFFDTMTGFAVGGNLYQEAGGIYSTTNGGMNWNLDINTSAEMFSIEAKRISADSADIWCVGSTGGGTGYTGKLYKASVYIVTGIRNSGGPIPVNFALYQNFPNPFNPSTTIPFSIPQPGQVKLSVYDLTGREVNILVNKFLNAGDYRSDWNASGLSSGVYFYKLEAGSYSDTKEMMFVK